MHTVINFLSLEVATETAANINNGAIGVIASVQPKADGTFNVIIGVSA